MLPACIFSALADLLALLELPVAFARSPHAQMMRSPGVPSIFVASGVAGRKDDRTQKQRQTEAQERETETEIET